MQNFSMDISEKVSVQLRSLYSRYGYSQFKMNKFEAYDLYARNKDFLISDQVITFTDLNGTLMALKPDVTLSIVKNSKDTPEYLQKLYYAENVYRAEKGSHCFKEIMQLGLECIGLVDDQCLCEVLTLAAESLLSISETCILEFSHLGLLSELLESIGIPKEMKQSVFKHIGEKNYHELAFDCRSCGIPEEKITVLQQILSTTGQPDAVLPKLMGMISGITGTGALEQLLRVVDAIDDSEIKAMLRFDFSVVDNIHYYNGLVFKGFIQGLPGSVLTGGQYDRLMRKMGRSSDAVGFAVYLDLLERLETERKAYDVDALVLYDKDTDLKMIGSCCNALRKQGMTVTAQQQIPENIRYKQLYRINGSEVELLENNA